MRAVVGTFVAIALAISAAGCSSIELPCLFTDADCTAAERFAETHIDINEWDATAATTISCDDYFAMSGAFETERCWRIELARGGKASHGKEAVIVVTTDGEFLRFGDAVTISR
jgi:hypothetical protein